MGFDVREAKSNAEARYPPFMVTDMDGEEHPIPHPGMLSGDQGVAMEAIQERATKEDWDAERYARELMGWLSEIAPDALAAIEGESTMIQAEFFLAYMHHIQEHSPTLADSDGDGDGEERPGKPSATSSARRPAAKRSKPTSKSGAKTGTPSAGTKSPALSVG